MASNQPVSLEDATGLSTNDSNNFYPNHPGFHGYEQDHAFNQSFDYPSNQLDLGRNSAWPDTLQPTSTAAVHPGYYGGDYTHPQSALVNADYSNGSFDPSLVTNVNLDTPVSSVYPDTISPHALQNQYLSYPSLPSVDAYPKLEPTLEPVKVKEEHLIPKGQAQGSFSITDAEELAKATKSKPLHHFVHVGDVAEDILITKSTIPAYNPRRSKNEIRRLLSSDSTLSSKLAKKASKKAASGTKATSTHTKAINAPGSPTVKSAASPASASSSDDESEAESSDDETMLSPLPAVRPTVALEAVKYDTIKALWRPTNRAATADEIRAGLKSFWEVVQTIRDRWKSDGAAVKKAEETKKVNELPLLKERVQTQRQMLQGVLEAALEFGHPDILEHLGENLPFIFCLAQFLADRSRDGDHDGPLPLLMLEILSRCKTLTEGSLEKTNVAKVLPRFQKRGNEKTQALCRRIQDNAIAALKKKREGAKAGATSASTTKESKPPSEGSPNSKIPAPLAGVKRQRVAEGATDQPQKKVASEQARSASISSNNSPGAAKGSPTAEKKAALPASNSKSASIAAVAAKPKIQHAVVKPSGLFSSLQSAAKKPGTSNAATAAATQAKVSTSAPSQANAVADKKPVAARSAAAPQPKPSFSWSETMASLNQPKKPEPSIKPEEEHAPESEEAKTKRLRKEKRRGLRVSFKPDASLVEIRVFTHDPDEELGHDASLVRDVGDVGSEGRMLKLHQDQMELDDDEDDSYDESLVQRDYVAPSLVDFSDIEDQQKEANFEPFGGGRLKPDSPEKLVQEQREANTLLMFYAKSSDIPPSPKEPPETTEEPAELVSFGSPPDNVLERVKSKEPPPVLPSYPQAAPDIAAILSKINSQPPQQQQAPPQTVPFQMPPAPIELEKVFAQFASQGNTSQPPQPTNPQSQNQAPDLQAILANLAPQLSMPQQPAPSQPAPVPQQDLQAILAQLGQASQGQQMGPAVPQMTGLQPPPQQNTNQNYPYENEERRRWRENGGGDDQSDDWNAQNRKGGNWPKDKKGERPKPMFVVQCRYWKEGKCQKGANCTFLHR